MDTPSSPPRPETRDKYSASTPTLLASLRHLRDTNPKAVRANVHLYPASIYAKDEGSGHRERRITSWKMTEYLYSQANNPLPTLARGLFTEELEEGDELPPGVEREVKERIVARGYDKFFNINDMEWSSWSAMQTHTQGPYYITLKSNGCLILIAALSPSHLVVASKHSLGTTIEEEPGSRVDNVVDGLQKLTVKEKRQGKGAANGLADKGAKEIRVHSEVGRRWLTRTLLAARKTEAELARRLWDTNSTAVLELCDDSFEQHVITTPAHWTGLHLHGLNANTPRFSTASPPEVTGFAVDFGFIPTKYVELQTLDEVKAFTDDVSRAGSWEGDQIEGFVIRSTVRDAEAPGKPPYRPDAPLFFKVKFEEPYLLYRQWRETTRAMLPLLECTSQEDEAAVWSKVRPKVTRPQVGVYADWCGRTIKEEPELFYDFDRGVGRVRERFIAWTDGEGAKAWADAKTGNYKLRPREKAELPQKWLLVPVAVPGCGESVDSYGAEFTGKTLLGVALTKLFGVQHTQSDDIIAKRTAPTFIRNITTLLKTNDVVYADRNNHIIKHYSELSEVADARPLTCFNVRLVAIVWDVKSQPYHRLLRICSERVVRRGDNHQTLRPDPTAKAEHEAVVGQFLRNWTLPDPELFDSVIRVQVADTPRQTLGKLVDGLVNELGFARPPDKVIDDALDAAVSYQVTTPYHAQPRVGKAVRYFGLALEIDLEAITDSAISSARSDFAQSAKALFGEIISAKRVIENPHATLAHKKSVEAEREAAGDVGEPGPLESCWNTCETLAEAKISPIYDFNITHLVWDDRVMVLALNDLQPRGDVSELDLPEEVKALLHVTVGTRTDKISTFESRGIVSVAKEGIRSNQHNQQQGQACEAVEGGGEVRWLKVDGVKGDGRIRGMY